MKTILYVHEATMDKSGLDALISRMTDYRVVNLVVDINTYEVSKKKVVDARYTIRPDIIVCESHASIFIHTLHGVNRICINPKLRPSLFCDETICEMYRKLEWSESVWDRHEDKEKDTHCWGIFGYDAEKRDFMLLYYPNVTIVPNAVSTIADVVEECASTIQMMTESSYVDDYGVWYAHFGSVIKDVDFVLFQGINEYRVPDDVVRVADSAFFLSSVKKITLPNSVSHIGKDAFRECCKLEEIILPPLITEIPTKCFYGCVSLKKVVLPKSLNVIRSWAFASCALESVEIPDGIQFIEPHAFDDGVRLIVSASRLSQSLRDEFEYRRIQAYDE